MSLLESSPPLVMRVTQCACSSASQPAHTMGLLPSTPTWRKYSRSAHRPAPGHYFERFPGRAPAALEMGFSLEYCTSVLSSEYCMLFVNVPDGVTISNLSLLITSNICSDDHLKPDKRIRSCDGAKILGIAGVPTANVQPSGRPCNKALTSLQKNMLTALFGLNHRQHWQVPE